ncbi:hypothetical protein N7494_004990 [Penicillium frequentans]|uniref:Uncharacterized protein n=1 Tax=Penicillium frequentans TaxID=3151616 RepID=A0AAD6D1N8_9EURO|nr:hypothetical protein N7494_004990 [Penicillium glabrum]
MYNVMRRLDGLFCEGRFDALFIRPRTMEELWTERTGGNRDGCSPGEGFVVRETRTNSSRNRSLALASGSSGSWWLTDPLWGV